MAGMLRLLTSKLKERDQRRRSAQEPRGAAIPYSEATNSASDEAEQDDVDDNDDDEIETEPEVVDGVGSVPSTPTSTDGSATGDTFHVIPLTSDPESPSTPTPTPALPRLALPSIDLASSRKELARRLVWSRSVGSQSQLTTPVTPGPGSAGPFVDPALFNAGRETIMALAESGDCDRLRSILKADCSAVNGVDEFGNTALHKAACRGHSRCVRYLLLYGADVDMKNSKGYNALFMAFESGHAGTVGILLDFMHSVDDRPREPFVILRARRSTPPASGRTPQPDQFADPYFVERARTCTQLRPFNRRRVDYVHMLVTHGQRADDMAIFLYSVLDVPVGHAFFLNGAGADLNMRNFQRFDERRRNESITILNTRVKTMDAVGYRHLRSLILVDCGLTQLTVDGLDALETLDIRHNRLTGLPADVDRCSRLRTLRVASNEIRRLSADIGCLSQLAAFDCGCNRLKRLTTHIVRCTELRSLECNDCGLVELPIDIGLLVNLEELRVQNNKLSQLPVSLSALAKLRRIAFAGNPLLNIPPDFPERASDVRQYLSSLQEDPVPNTVVKLVVVGQEGVGKTSLLRAIKRTFRLLSPGSTPTDGIDVKEIQLNGVTLRCFDCGGDVDFNETHNFFITHGALYLTCFNLSEYCISTVERASFLFGRLQLWLQYIFSKVPNALVLIVGTHADHPALNRTTLEQIWQQLRLLLVDARDHHRHYFSAAERLPDCLLCQPDSQCRRRSASSSPPTHAKGPGFVNLGFENGGRLSGGSVNGGGSTAATSTAEEEGEVEETSFCSGDDCSVTFPHILGYYEVSSCGGSGLTSPIGGSRGIDQLKDAISSIVSRLISANPEMPRRWANVDESLRAHVERSSGSTKISTVDEVSRIAAVQGVTDRLELINMLHFFRAQGRLLYFPQLADLDEIVILDPEWLARIFATVVTYRDAGIDERGFIDRDQLRRTWTGMDRAMRDRVLALLRHFGLCLPVDGTNWELFPCRLPLGEPDPSVWSPVPQKHERQISYSVTFPAIIPPPFFNNLIAAIYSYRAASPSGSPVICNSVVNGCGAEMLGGGRTTGVDGPHYFANLIVDWIRLDTVGCRDCGLRDAAAADGGGDPHVITGRSLNHRILIELVAHRRTIQVTARGALPCCAVKKVALIFNRVVRHFDGLGSIAFDAVLCPGCVIARRRGSSTGTSAPYKFRLRSLVTAVADRRRSLCPSDERLTCPNGHVIPSCRDLLCGVLNESFFPGSAASHEPKSRKHKEFLHGSLHGTADQSNCPRLFILLPVNKDGLSFDRDLHLFASTLVPDGYAVHLLCEFPDGYHLTSTPGYRLRSPKEFVQRYGPHVVAVLRLLGRLASSSAVSTQFAARTRVVTRVADSLIRDFAARFPGVRAAGTGSSKAASSDVDDSAASTTEHLRQDVDELATRLRRDELRRFLHLAADRPDSFGPLRRLRYDTVAGSVGSAHALWLCADHYRQMCGVIALGDASKNVAR